jgi:hypothetical protein
MEITINDSVKIEDIQKQFSRYYPFLKIEFFKREHEESKASTKKDMLNRQLTLREARTTHNSGLLVIHPDQKISELEHDFQKVFGLPVQVFRKVGKSWIETTKTDGRTIREQNKWARLLSEEAGIKQVAEWDGDE